MRKVVFALNTSVLVLTGLGLLFVASASNVKAADPFFFLKRQLVWLVVALALGYLASRFDYHLWEKRPWLKAALLAAAILGLLAVFVPHVGRYSHGSNRWISFGSAQFQPSEIAKVATVILMAAWMASIGWRVRKFKEGVMIPLAVLGLFLLLLLKEPDFGATLVTAVVGIGIMFAAGVRFVYLLLVAAAGGLGFVGMILRDPVRGERVMVYIVKLFGKTSWVTEQLAGFMGKSMDRLVQDVEASNKRHQIEQSLLAFNNGGAWGVGLNNSMQKHYYLPEAHTDFIYAIAGEEGGLLASLAILLFYGVLLFCGLYITLRAPDRLGRLMAFGLTLLIVFQAFFNIGVVTDCLPTKGLALPFLSYGGSNLITAFVTVGILHNIAKHVEKPDDHVHAQIFDGEMQEA